MTQTDIQIGVISDVQYIALGNGKTCEVKADVDGRTTNWLPLKQKISSFYKEHIPPRVGDQCMVFNQSGKSEDGFVDGNIAYEKVALPHDIDENKIVRWAIDGTTYIHDTKAEEITLKTPCSITVEAEKDVMIKAPLVTIDSNLKVTGTITDVRGDLTNHMNATFPRV